MSSKSRFFAEACLTLFVPVAFAATPTVFIPDATFQGSSLDGWRTLGAADWTANNGELTGKPKNPAGGWLILDKSYQDVGVFASFRCSGDCKTGVLLRAEKTAEGMKGILMSLTESDLAVYRVTLDAQGKELSREKLRPGGGQIRIAPPEKPKPQAQTARPTRPEMIANLPLKAPAGGYRSGDWNQIELILDANILRPFLNDGSSGGMGSVAEEAYGRYGPIALYVGGSGEVHFKDVSYKDLNGKFLPKEQAGETFNVQRIDDFYYAWSAAVGDFNHDGVMDVAAGPYYYPGPEYTTRKEIYLAQTVNPSTEYPEKCMSNFAYDFTGDGWTDVVCMGAIGQPLHLYVNPKGESRRWDEYDVIPQVSKEVSLLKDIDGDGKLEFVYGGGGALRYAKPDPGNPTGAWVVHTISEPGPWGAGHGLGVGDINGDGRMDVVDPYGWWEQPAAGSGQELWKYHPAAFGLWTGHASPGGDEMAVYDVNGDGLNDIVTTLQAHGFGLVWFEQKRENGAISFVQHMIMNDLATKNPGGVTISEMHASTYADVDGDGIPDFIVGKRFWSHRDDYTDPDPYGPPVLYWFKTVRNPSAPGGAEFVPHQVHNRSGAGNHIQAMDINGDGSVDIVTSTDRGTFVFWGKPHQVARR